jgi:protein Tex
MARSHTEIISTELKLSPAQVERTLALLQEGATIPFISRYRKEVTGGLDEVQIGSIDERRGYLADLDARKETVLKEIASQGKLDDALKKKIESTLSKTELEDLYLPYKPKRRTRATIARDRGLEPLAEKILEQNEREPSKEELARPFLKEDVPDAEAAFAGARDIVAERVSERAEIRAALRAEALASGALVSTVIPGKEVEGAKFKDYFELREPAARVPSHRLLAMRRGEKEGFLRVALEVDETEALGKVRHFVTLRQTAALARELEAAVADGYERLLKPSIEVDVRLALKERADAEAIGVFAENLRHLLLQAPLGGKRVLALDPGFRTGCKTVVVDEKGDLQESTVIYPDRHADTATAAVEALCKKHRVEAIAVGNGTAGRETEGFVRKIAARLGGAKIVVVNESGASIYSASEIAREEFPDEDVTVRGAVSIGRRLQDPLAELVKIDPKSIGVGQYQHDVHQPSLKKTLDGVVESCVNKVGVDLNTASWKLLAYVAGVGETLAKNIVGHRASAGAFRSRKQLLDVPRFGQKAFEQAAGFLRVRGGEPLDDSAVHPESYDVVGRMAADLGVEVKGLVGNAALARKIEVQKYVDDKRGLPTLKDIVAELEKPGRDPRAEFEEVGFNPEVTEFSHLKEGMVLNGVVTNVTQFGAFVDVGVHQDGLVHVSELAHRFVKDPAEVAKVGDRVKVKVIKVDVERRRIGLSVKQAASPPGAPAPAPNAAPQQKSAAPQPKPQKSAAPQQKPAPGKPGPFNNPFAAALSGLKKGSS